jgi:hypothetical protein
LTEAVEKKMQKPLVIHFVAGPCTGKTTVSAGVFHKLKCGGVSVELVPELVKRYIWKSVSNPSKFQLINDQYLMSDKHYKSFEPILQSGQVKVVVLDGSPLNSLWYNRNNKNNTSDVELTEKMIVERYRQLNARSLVIFLNRDSRLEYTENGRIHTRDEAVKMDSEIKQMLDNHGIKYAVANTYNIDDIVSLIEYYL